MTDAIVSTNLLEHLIKMPLCGKFIAGLRSALAALAAAQGTANYIEITNAECSQSAGVIEGCWLRQHSRWRQIRGTDELPIDPFEHPYRCLFSGSVRTEGVQASSTEVCLHVSYHLTMRAQHDSPRRVARDAESQRCRSVACFWNEALGAFDLDLKGLRQGRHGLHTSQEWA